MKKGSAKKEEKERCNLAGSRCSRVWLHREKKLPGGREKWPDLWGGKHRC